MKATSAYKLLKQPGHNKRLRLPYIFTLISILLVCLLLPFVAFAEKPEDETTTQKSVPAKELQSHDFNLAMKGIVNKTDQAILETLTEAANSGSATAALALGNRYFDGTGVDKSLETALLWWAKSSDLGSPSASYNLGVAHLGGDGLAKNLTEARAAFTKAARLGVVDAHLALGILDLHEARTQEAFKRAGEHFRRAATAGSSSASHNLSVLYEKGLGYAQDSEKAEYWRDYVADRENPKPSLSSNLSNTTSLSIEHIVHDSDWIVTRPAENYTLQLASGDTLKGTKKLISKITTLECAVFTKIFAKKERFVAIAGDFLSYADALSAIEELPTKFLQNKPFIVNFELLQQQIAEHTEFNN